MPGLVLGLLTPTLFQQATDADNDTNSEIRYSIVCGDPLNHFTIDEVTGNITNTGPLDFENESEYWLEVMAKDQGTPPLNSTKTVHITVMVRMKYGDGKG